MFTVSPRLPLIAVLGCLVLSACDQSGAPSGSPSQRDATAVAEQGQVGASPVDPSAAAGPTSLTEIEQATRSIEMPASGMCSFDKINGASVIAASPVRVQSASDLSVSGWVVERGTMARPQAVLRVQEASGGRAWEIGVGPGTSRGDVGRHFEKEGLKDAGFEVVANLAGLPPGEYALSLNHHSGDRRVNCDKGTRIVIDG